MTFPRVSSALLTLTLALAGCGPAGIGSFSIGYDVDEQQVPGNPIGGALGGAIDVPIPLDIDLEAETASRDTGPAQHVFLIELRLDITRTAEPSGDTDDFDFIDTIEIYAESAQAGSSLPRQRVAYLESVPRGQRTIQLSLDDVDIIDYVREGARLTSTATGTVPPDDVTFTGHLTLAIGLVP